MAFVANGLAQIEVSEILWRVVLSLGAYAISVATGVGVGVATGEGEVVGIGATGEAVGVGAGRFTTVPLLQRYLLPDTRQVYCFPALDLTNPGFGHAPVSDLELAEAIVALNPIPMLRTAIQMKLARERNRCFDCRFTTTLPRNWHRIDRL